MTYAEAIKKIESDTNLEYDIESTYRKRNKRMFSPAKRELEFTVTIFNRTGQAWHEAPSLEAAVVGALNELAGGALGDTEKESVEALDKSIATARVD